MTNLAAPVSSIYNGLFWNEVGSRMEVYYRDQKCTQVERPRME